MKNSYFCLPGDEILGGKGVPEGPGEKYKEKFWKTKDKEIFFFQFKITFCLAGEMRVSLEH